MIRNPAIRTALVALAALVVIVAGYSALTLLGLDANAISAVATAVAAIAAFASASSSSTAARESVRALSYATKPELRLTSDAMEDGAMSVTIVNDSLHPATGVVLRWKLRTGGTGSRSLGELQADTLQRRGVTVGHQGPSIRTPMEPSPGKVSGVDHFEVEYGSKLGATRWITEWDVELRFEHSDGVSSFSRHVVAKGEREVRLGRP